MSETSLNRTDSPETMQRRRSRSWVSWSIAAGLAIGIFALSVQNHALNDELRDESTLVSNLAGKASRAQQAWEVLTAPNAQRAMLTLGKSSREPIGSVIYLPDRGGLVFVASNLQPLAAGKTYQLWIVPGEGKAPIAAGVFLPDASGSANVVLPSLPPGVTAKEFGVTVEKAGGSAVQTAPALLSGSASGS